MHYSSTLPRRPRQVKVPPAPTAAQISKRLKPVLFDDRSSERRKKKVRFTGWAKKREMLVNRRAVCLKHIVVLSTLLVLVTASTLGILTLPDLVESDISPTEDACVVETFNLLEIVERSNFTTVIPRAMLLGSTPTAYEILGVQDIISVEEDPHVNTSFYDHEVVTAFRELEDASFEYDVFTSDVYSYLTFIEYPVYEEETVEEEVVVEEYVPEEEYVLYEPYYVPYIEEYIPYIPYEPYVSEPLVLEVPLTPLTGSHDEIVWNFFISRGFSPQATAGIIGNLQQESSPAINPDTVGDVNLATSSRGIAQWREGRLRDLQSFANARGAPWNELYIQLEFMYLELNCEAMQRRFRGDSTGWGNYMPALTRKNATPVDGLQGFKNETCVENAVRVMDAAFHRSGVPNFPRRIRFANEALAKFYTGVSY